MRRETRIAWITGGVLALVGAVVLWLSADSVAVDEGEVGTTRTEQTGDY